MERIRSDYVNWLEEMIKAYSYRLTLIQSMKRVHKTAAEMRFAGYSDEAIEAIADAARSFYGYEEIERDYA